MGGFSVTRYAPTQQGLWSRLTARLTVRRLDWPILLSAVALSLIGSALVYSATRNRTEINQGDPYYFLHPPPHEHRHRIRPDGRHDLAGPPHPACGGAGAVRHLGAA